MDKIKRTERGWGAHFVGAKNCLFRRNTLIEKGESRYVVSTVGNWQIPVEDETYDNTHEISPGRYYETLVFKATFIDPYWEAEIQKQIHVDAKQEIAKSSVTSDFEANEMHEGVVKEIIERLNSGEL